MRSGGIRWKSIVRTAIQGHIKPKLKDLDSTTRNQEQSMVGPIGNLLTGAMRSGGMMMVIGLLGRQVTLESHVEGYTHMLTWHVRMNQLTLGNSIPLIWMIGLLGRQVTLESHVEGY